MTASPQCPGPPNLFSECDHGNHAPHAYQTVPTMRVDQDVTPGPEEVEGSFEPTVLEQTVYGDTYRCPHQNKQVVPGTCELCNEAANIVAEAYRKTLK